MTALKFALPALAVLGLSMGAAQAAGLDANGDGLVTYDELLAVMPDLNEEEFAVLDIDANGALDADEVAAAIEEGIIPAK